MVLVAGAKADDAVFEKAVANSCAASSLVDQTSVSPHNLVDLGAAQAAKERLESHIFDCFETEECQMIRKKADEIAGACRRPEPTVWPASWRHDEL